MRLAWRTSTPAVAADPPSSPSSPSVVKVVYFSGSGRSGTTMINTILGQLPGVVAAGELRYFWQRGMVDEHHCGCGRTFQECPFWTAVVSDLAGPVQAQGIADRLLQRLRVARLPAILGRHAVHRPAVPPHADDAVIASLYRAIAAHSGARLIIDSSKLPPYGLLLLQLADVQLYVLHVVRDPRATAFSWLRTKPLDQAGTEELMLRPPVWKSSALWLLWNTTTALVWGRDRRRYLRVRYEDFAQSPRTVMTEVVKFLGLDPGGLPFTSETSLLLRPTHSVAGNPDRHTTGQVQVRPDVEWSTAMNRGDRLVATVVTLPALRWLGYRARARP